MLYITILKPYYNHITYVIAGGGYNMVIDGIIYHNHMVIRTTILINIQYFFLTTMLQLL